MNLFKIQRIYFFLFVHLTIYRKRSRTIAFSTVLQRTIWLERSARGIMQHSPEDATQWSSERGIRYHREEWYLKTGYS